MTRWGRKGNKRKRQRESQLVEFFFCLLENGIRTDFLCLHINSKQKDLNTKDSVCKVKSCECSGKDLIC